MDPTAFASSLVGVVVPVVVQLVRRHILPWDDRAAHWLALAIAAAAVTAGYFSQAGVHTWNGWLGNFGLAYTLSQAVYHQVGDYFKNTPPDDGDDGNDEDGGLGSPSGPSPLVVTPFAGAAHSFIGQTANPARPLVASGNPVWP